MTEMKGYINHSKGSGKSLILSDIVEYCSSASIRVNDIVNGKCNYCYLYV